MQDELQAKFCRWGTSLQPVAMWCYAANAKGFGALTPSE